MHLGQSTARYSTRVCCTALLVVLVSGQSAVAQLEDVPPEFSLFRFIQEEIRHTPPKLAVPQELGQIPQWQAKAARRLRDLLRIDGSTPVPLNPRVTQTQQHDGYRSERIVFSSEAYVDVPGVILIPDGVSASIPAPAVLCIHGGVGAGKEEVIGNTAHPMAARGLKVYGDDYARQLVRQGFVTFAIDLRNHGERRYYRKDDLHGLNSPAKAMRSAGIHALMAGRTYFGLNLFDNIRALDYLQTRPEVQPEAIGCVGFSLGGNLAAWLTAIDRRIKAAAIVGSWASWQRLASASLDNKEVTHKNAPVHLLAGLSYQTIPDFFVYMDMNISVAIAAPTPMAVAYEYDIWQFEDLEQAKEDTLPIKQAYTGFNASDNLHLEFFDGGHRWRKAILPWFTDKLRQSSPNN